MLGCNSVAFGCSSFGILADQAEIPIEHDAAISAQWIAATRASTLETQSEREIAESTPSLCSINRIDMTIVETVRRQLLGQTPERFEHTVKHTLEKVGFENVAVTHYSQDGGIDVNAVVGAKLWPISNLLVQAQAKRWLHTVGRQEVAELRGSLQPHARGLVVTTSHFSRAAILEANEVGKLPIVLVDGISFAAIVHTHEILV